MNISKRILALFGWSVEITAPRLNKCVICVAPHTSNWDFPLGILAYKSVGRRANFLMKEAWFFWPMKYLFRALGGIAVPKAKGARLSEEIIERFGKDTYINLAVTPEATRSPNPEWRKGFLYIAHGAGVPIQLGVIDYARRHIEIKEQFIPTGDVDADMAYVKHFYKDAAHKALYPQKFKL